MVNMDVFEVDEHYGGVEEKESNESLDTEGYYVEEGMTGGPRPG